MVTENMSHSIVGRWVMYALIRISGSSSLEAITQTDFTDMDTIWNVQYEV